MHQSQAAIRLMLELKPLPIPYGQSNRADGENFGYKSILKNPKTIDEIPELFAEPSVKDFILSIHSPMGVFETVRVVHWLQTHDGISTKSMALGFVFRDRRLFNSYANCIAFSGNVLMEMCKGKILYDDPPLVDIQPACFLEENAHGWIMDFYVSGRGASEDEARQRFDRNMASLKTIFQTGMASE